jgi:hypothetical protein
MRVSNSRKTQRRQLNQSIAEAARLLVELVREHVDSRGRVDSSLLACIKIDHSFVSASFLDYPDEFGDLVDWRKR